MPQYINNKALRNLLIDYKETRSRKTFNEIGKAFLLIATNLLNRASFINYTKDRKQEMISDATFFMVKYVDKFDVSRNNPFSYFTMVAKHAFLQNINSYTRRDGFFRSIDYIENFEKRDY